MDGEKSSRGRARTPCWAELPCRETYGTTKKRGVRFAGVKLGGSCRETRFAVWGHNAGNCQKIRKGEAPAQPLDDKLLIQNGSVGGKGAVVKLEKLDDGLGRAAPSPPAGSPCFFQLGAQPGSGSRPVPFHGDRRHAERFGGFFHREAAKVSQFDNPALARVHLLEAVQRFVKCQQLVRTLHLKKVPVLVERNLLKVPATLGRPVPASRVDENLPHEAGSYTDEMRAALPVQVLIASQFQVGLMDESRWLQRVPRPFVTQIVPGEAAQLVHH
jgi:hypothetical protein